MCVFIYIYIYIYIYRNGCLYIYISYKHPRSSMFFIGIFQVKSTIQSELGVPISARFDCEGHGHRRSALARHRLGPVALCVARWIRELVLCQHDRMGPPSDVNVGLYTIISPINYSYIIYIYHKPELSHLYLNLAILGAASCMVK